MNLVNVYHFPIRIDAFYYISILWTLINIDSTKKLALYISDVLLIFMKINAQRSDFGKNPKGNGPTRKVQAPYSRSCLTKIWFWLIIVTSVF